MNKIYIVCWASGWQDDHGNTQTNSGVHGAFDSLDKAKTALEEYKNLFIEQLVEDLIDGEELSVDEIQEIRDNLAIEVYGSVNDGYFEIDYDSWDTRNEMHISIRDVEVQ